MAVRNLQNSRASEGSSKAVESMPVLRCSSPQSDCRTGSTEGHRRLVWTHRTWQTKTESLSQSLSHSAHVSTVLAESIRLPLTLVDCHAPEGCPSSTSQTSAIGAVDDRSAARQENHQTKNCFGLMGTLTRHPTHYTCCEAASDRERFVVHAKLAAKMISNSMSWLSFTIEKRQNE